MSLEKASFENKTVLVTGGANGIGYAIAEKFDRLGAKTVIVDIQREQGEEAAHKLNNAIFIQADVSRRDTIVKMTDQAVAEVKRIDILINNAGASKHTKAFDISEENWDFCVDLMYSGFFFCSQAIGKHMAASGGGVIINMASMNALLSLPGRVLYSSIKAAVVSMTKTLAAEWAACNIRVNAVSPGVTLTKLVSDTFESGHANMDSYLKRTPLNRLGSPQEIADACCYLASDQASFITGHNLVIDGGFSSYNWTDILHEN